MGSVWMAQSLVSVPEEGSTAGGDRSLYAELLGRVRDAGLLRRNVRFYIFHMCLDGLLLSAGWAAFFVLGNTWWQVLSAVFLGLVFGQLGFLGHDAGHRQVFKSRRRNDLLGIVLGNFVTGVSFGWWNDKHRRHHTYPNYENLDPDISGKAVAFTPAAARRRRGVMRWIGRYQAFIVGAILPVQSVVLHVKSCWFLATSASRYRRVEIIGMSLHAVLYFGAIFSVLSPGKAVAFIAVQQGVFGLCMALAFAPNHKGMPTVGEGEQRDFLWRQVVTARNVTGSRVLDFAMGGLNFQIEHHLFPSMARPTLRKAQPLVKRFCIDNSIPYVETTLRASYRQAFGHLHEVARPR